MNLGTCSTPDQFVQIIQKTSATVRHDTLDVVSNLKLNPTIKGFKFEVYESTVELNPIIKGYIEKHSNSSHVNSQLRVGEDLVAPPPLCASASAWPVNLDKSWDQKNIVFSKLRGFAHICPSRIKSKMCSMGWFKGKS